MERAFYKSLGEEPEDSLDDILVFSDGTWCFRFEYDEDQNEEYDYIIRASTDEADEFLIDNGITPE